jgi:hypothetical protein
MQRFHAGWIAGPPIKALYPPALTSTYWHEAKA